MGPWSPKHSYLYMRIIYLELCPLIQSKFPLMKGLTLKASGGKSFYCFDRAKWAAPSNFEYLTIITITNNQLTLVEINTKEIKTQSHD